MKIKLIAQTWIAPGFGEIVSLSSSRRELGKMKTEQRRREKQFEKARECDKELPEGEEPAEPIGDSWLIEIDEDSPFAVMAGSAGTVFLNQDEEDILYGNEVD